MTDRIKDMEKVIKEYRTKRLETMQKHTTKYISDLDATFCKALNAVIEKQLQRQLEDGETKIRHLYFCRLHTSDYTGSYGAKIGMSDSRMYLDEKLSLADWYPTPLYASLDKDMEAVTKLLQRTFIRLQESELYAMKQRLADDSWIVAELCFHTLVQNNFSFIVDSKLRLENEILILCGDYMDKLKIIDTKSRDADKKGPQMA